MIGRGALAVLALVLFLVAQAPASWVAERIRTLGGDRLRLINVAGSVWSGRGDLWFHDPDSRGGTPWKTIRWDFEAGGLARGELRWRLRSGEESGCVLFLTGGRQGVRDLAWLLPAGPVLAWLPGLAGRLGWSGELLLTVVDWNCDLAGTACRGNGHLLWQGAASALLPLPAAGDYGIQARADGQQIELSWSTLSGKLQTRGQVRLDGAEVRGEGWISGPPEQLAGLPTIADRWVQATATPGHYRLRFADRATGIDR